MNDFNESGFYRLEKSDELINFPPDATGYGTLIIGKMGIAILQIYITRENPHKMYIRCFNPEKEIETAWTQLTNSTKTVTSQLEVNGVSKLNGNLEVSGDITQKGSSYITHAEEVKTKKDYITLREGATTALADGSYAGIEAIKYDGTNNGRLVFDKNGTARVGDVGDEEPLATRAEDSAMADGKFVKWNSTTKRIETSSDSIATINDTTSSSASAYSSSKTNTQIDNLTKLYGQCNTSANVQAKTVSISSISASYVKVGREINVMFTKGSTYLYEEGGLTNWGQCTGLTGETGNATTNELTRSQAPTLSVNGSTAYPITVAGQYAGEGFVNANEVHTLVLVSRSDGYAWEDLTAKNIYCNKTRNYSKNRDGLIEQWGLYSSYSAWQNPIYYPIIFSNKDYYVRTNHVTSSTATPTFSQCNAFSLTVNSFTSNTAGVDIKWFAKGY